MYWRKPTAAELVGTAYRPDDYVEPVCDVWDENWNAIQLFAGYSTQWRIGMNGPVALDYNVFHHALDRKEIKGRAFDEMMDNLRLIESVALQQMHKDL